MNLDGRRGFSLLELLVVVAIIGFLAAMVAPNVIAQVRENRVAQAAESVREVIVEARNFAIDSGIDYQFRYEPNGQRFVVLPRELEPGEANSTDSDSATGNYLRLSGQLEESIRFSAPEDSDEAIETLDSRWFGQLADALSLSQLNWSAPIVFRFDGRADDGAFRVVSESGLTADLEVRGLTAGIRVSRVYPEAD